MLAIWSLELTKEVMKVLMIFFSLWNWQSTSICFILSWKTRMGERCKADRLSHTSYIGPISQIRNSYSKCFNLKSSHVACAITRLSFCTWSSNNNLLFARQWDQISTHKNTIIWFRASITCISCPINIWISNDITIASNKKQGFFQVILWCT